jgi:hypothetical protein
MECPRNRRKADDSYASTHLAAMECRGRGVLSMPRSATKKPSVAAHGSRQTRQKQYPEPDLVMLLSDPEVRLLMQADKVEESQLREMLEQVSVQLEASRAALDASYRPGVGIVLLNNDNRVSWADA